jgi:RHS repeat-associated protein
VDVRRKHCDSGRFHYNYFRDYDPGIGRYIESDPIGLRGGLATFAYVRAQPLTHRDVLGLKDTSGGKPAVCHYKDRLETLVQKGPFFGLPETLDVVCYYYCPPTTFCPVNPEWYMRKMTMRGVVRVVF